MKLSLVLSTQPAAFSALAYQGQFEKHVAKIAALGFDGVELAVRDPSLLDLPRIKEHVRANNLSVPAIGTGQAYGDEGVSFTHLDESVRRQAVARIEKHIELAAQLNALVIIGLIRGKTSPALSRKQAHDWLLGALRECAAMASQRQVKLALEPINRYETDLVNTVSEGLALIETVGMANLGLLLDTFHMNIEEPSIIEGIRQAGPRIFHVHIADSNRWHPGAGHVDFQRVVEVLREVGYDGFLSAEILPLPDADTCAQKTIAAMRTILKGV